LGALHLPVLLATIFLALAGGIGRPLAAAWPAAADDPTEEGTSSATARREAIRALPTAKLDAHSRAKVAAVLKSVTLYRRMPLRSVSCDPDLYVFLVRHPDVIVNIWEVLGVAQLQLRQTGADTFREDEKEGTSASLQFLYKTRETHLVYGEWRYTGTVLPRAVRGRCLAMLRSGYVRQADGTYSISNCLDAFVSVEPGGVELLSKIFYPLIAKTADINFLQTAGFVASLSRTAEVNSRGVQRLAGRLTHVQPEVRRKFADLAFEVHRKAVAADSTAADEPWPGDSPLIPGLAPSSGEGGRQVLMQSDTAAAR
jgi:hypothetical protein